MSTFLESLKCGGSLGRMDSRFSLKGTTASYAPDRTFDTQHIKLDLAVDINRETIKGRCSTTLKAIADEARMMVFDAVNFKILSIGMSGKRLPFIYKDGKLKVTLPKNAKAGSVVVIDIDYVVEKPKLGLYFIKPNKQYPQRPTQVWTQGEDEYARYWFPCHDAPQERTSTEVVATVPRGFTAVSNGKLLKTSHNKRAKTTTFHWKNTIPHATYLVTLAIGRFQLIKDKWRHVPVEYYCESGREADTKRAFGNTPRMMEFFSKFIGTAYPYPKYAQVAAADFIYGGMENTSATTQTDAALLDERVSLDYTSDELVAHELAHQWFGDYLTCKDWSHAWLNESFATYFDALYKRFDRGDDEYLYQIRINTNAYLDEDKEHYRRSIVTKLFRRPTDLFDRHLYEKGSVVLYMLHRFLGEKLFQKSIATYTRRNKGQVVETLDLISAIEETTGRNMRRFFDQWVFGAGHPEFKIRTWWDGRKKQLKARVTQSHAQGSETGLFHVDTEFSFYTARGEKRVAVHIEKKSELFTFDLDAEPELVQFDPEHILLKRVDYPKTGKMLIQQLAKAKNVLSRIDALHALAKMASPDALRAIQTSLSSDKFWGVQVEAAKALGSISTEEASIILLHGLDEIQHPKVRRAIYGALRSFNTQKIAIEVEKRFRNEKSYFAEAEALRLLGAFHHPRYEEILKSALKKESWNDITRQAALEGFALSKSRQWLPLIISYTRSGHGQKLRLAAIRCLAQFEPGLPGLQERALELLKDPFPLAQITAVRLLQQIGDERAVPLLKKIIDSDVDGRFKRLAEEAVGKITKGFE